MSEPHAVDACHELVALIERLGAQAPGPRALLVRLGAEAAGIRPGPRALIDLARGGRNRIPGGGVRPRLDDDSGGQVRHFAGIASAAARIGATPTRWLSVVVGRDAPSSPDGRLTDLAVSFARQLTRGTLPMTDAAGWVRDNVCGSPRERR